MKITKKNRYSTDSTQNNQQINRLIITEPTMEKKSKNLNCSKIEFLTGLAET